VGAALPRQIVAGGTQRRRARRGRRKQILIGLCYLAPALVMLGGVLLYPIGYNIWLSLHSYNLSELYLGEHFVWLHNYLDELRDPYFWSALRNSAIITGSCLALELPIGMGLALLLHRRLRGHSVFRFLFFLPLLLVPAVTAYMWRFLFQYTGVFNYLLQQLHLGRVNWSTTQAGIISVIIVTVWENVPFALIVFLAGLQSIDPELEAAAHVDGADGLQRFRHIVLPLMRPFVLIVVAIRTMDLLRLFDEGYILTGGGPGRTTETLSQLVYTETFTFFDVGHGAAISILEALIVVLATAFVFVTLRTRRGGWRSP